MRVGGDAAVQANDEFELVLGLVTDVVFTLMRSEEELRGDCDDDRTAVRKAWIVEKAFC